MKIINQKGITLIALVITIVVLLILSGISLAMFIGDSSLFGQSRKAKESQKRAETVENAKVDIIAEQTTAKKFELDRETIKKVLDKYFDNVPDDFTADTELTTKSEYGNYKAKVSEIYAGKIPPVVISKTNSYVGYYADIDEDGTVDGIIYADLAYGNKENGNWGEEEGTYSIPKDSSGLKDYYVSNKSYTDKFGTNAVLSPTGTGNDRFYIMALKDVGGYFDWYNAAHGAMKDYASTTSTKFGKGKDNTDAMIKKWDGKKYGEQNTCAQNEKDIWGAIKEQYNKGWFVPSKEEWAAFSGELKIDVENYIGKGLDMYYWTSSQSDDKRAWFVNYYRGSMDLYDVNTSESIRLSKTF